MAASGGAAQRRQLCGAPLGGVVGGGGGPCLGELRGGGFNGTLDATHSCGEPGQSVHH